MNKKNKLIITLFLVLMLGNVFIFSSGVLAKNITTISTLAPNITIQTKILEQGFIKGNEQAGQYLSGLTAQSESFLGGGLVLSGSLDFRFEQYFTLGASKGAAVMMVSNIERWQNMLEQRKLHPDIRGFTDSARGMWFYIGIGAARFLNYVSHEYVHVSHAYIHENLFSTNTNPITDYDIIRTLALTAGDKQWAQVFCQIDTVLRFKYNYLGIIISDVLENRIDTTKAEKQILKLFEGRLPESLRVDNFGERKNLEPSVLFGLTKTELKWVLMLNRNSDAVVASEFFAWVYGQLISKIYYPQETYNQKKINNSVQEALIKNIDKFLFEVFASDISGTQKVKQVMTWHFSKYDIPFFTLKGILLNEKITDHVKYLLNKERQDMFIYQVEQAI